MSDSEAASIASEQFEEAASGSASESDEETSPEKQKREPAKDKKKKKKKKVQCCKFTWAISACSAAISSVAIFTEKEK